MKKRPNSIWHMMYQPNNAVGHMTQWGCAGGFVLAFAYGLILMMFSLITNPPPDIRVFISVIITIPAQAFFAVFLGAIPGLVMGACVGVLLSWMTRQAAPPFSNVDWRC